MVEKRFHYHYCGQDLVLIRTLERIRRIETGFLRTEIKVIKVGIWQCPVCKHQWIREIKG